MNGKNRNNMDRKEAIETIRRCMPRVGDSQCDFETALRELIPELAESEDERMPRMIGLALTDVPEERFTSLGTTLKDCLAYLEKLKEQFWVPTDEQRHALGMVLKYSDSNDDSTKVLESLLDDLTKVANPKVAKWKEKQKEQKPAENVSKKECVKRFKALCDAYEIKLPNREYDIYHLCDDLSKLFTNSDKQKPVECKEDMQLLAGDYAISHYQQGRTYSSLEVHKMLADAFIAGKSYHKPEEWSEEDRHAIENCEYAIKETFKDEQNPHRIGTLDWLKSLPERFNLQPKQEWSEEDEKMVQFWNMYYEHKVGDWSNKDVIEHLERFQEWFNNRFRFLRPEPKGKWAKRLEEARARWKPSEEQKPIVIQVENPNIQKLDPNVIIETRTNGTGEPYREPIPGVKKVF